MPCRPSLNGRSRRLVPYFPAPIFCQHNYGSSRTHLRINWAQICTLTFEIRKNLAATFYVQLPMETKMLT